MRKIECGPALQKGYQWVISNVHLAQSIVSVGDDADALGRGNKKKVSVRQCFLSLLHSSV